MDRLSIVKGTPVHIRDAVEADLVGALAIYNHAVVNTTAVWSDQPSTLEERKAWLAAKRSSRNLVLVAVSGEKVIGFASYGQFRPWPGYAHSIEHSVHVDPDHHRQGVGTALLSALIGRARNDGFHAMIAGIDAS